MATDKDPDKEKDVSNAKKQEVANVADMSIASIIAALHQQAISKSNAKEKNARIINGAIDDSSNKPTIRSAGENIVSVVPLKDGDVVKKKDAVSILKTYIQWFVGPDFANKVNSSTVKSLTSSPDSMKESFQFKSFKSFLLEAKEESSENPKDEGENDLNNKDSKKDSNSSQKKDDTKDKSTDESDEESKVGYYIPYKLEVEGMKQTALKDAMKKYAKTFFDDVKITASGLFGGGDSFTLKDVKDKFKEAFGAINPDELVQNVQKEIDSIRNPATESPEVRVRDKDTLISDLGSAIDGAQKKLISSADYSLWIKLQEEDPKKQIFDRRVIADIVTGSIKGLFKKFKNSVTKNDVVYIKDYQDIHKDTKALQALINAVPTPEQVINALYKSKSYVNAMANLEKLFDKISSKTKLKDKSPFVSRCLDVWTKFYTNVQKDPLHKDPTEFPSNDAQKKVKIDALFKKDFIDNYESIYKKMESKKQLYEAIYMSMEMSNLVGSLSSMKQLVLESLLGHSISEDEPSNDGKQDKNTDKEQDKKDDKEIVSKIKKHAKFIFEDVDGHSAQNIVVSNKDALVKLLSIYEDSSVLGGYFSDPKNKTMFNNGIAVDFSRKTIIEDKTLNEQSSLKNEIMSIMFEDDSEEKQKTKYPKKDVVKKAFNMLCKNAKLSPEMHGKVYALKYDKDELSEAKKKQIDLPEAYLMPFGGKKIEDSPNDNNAENAETSNEGRSEDLYIVPMPGLRMNDKEYDTYAK